MVIEIHPNPGTKVDTLDARQASFKKEGALGKISI
jgi:hypothetical protein